MSENPNKLIRFWEELKRRKTSKVIVAYAATSFILLQLADILTPSLLLPSWTTRLVTLILIIGFPLAVIFSWIFDITPDGIIKTESEATDKDNRKPGSSNTWKIVSYVSIIIIIALLAFNIVNRKKSEDPAKMNKSIAVLPFKLLSNEPDKQYLADGMMDAITLDLYKVKDLLVISGTSVEQYRGTTKTASTIGQELGVSYLLEGSFQKSGDKVKLIVKLIKTRKEGHVWANDYDRNWSDIFKVQSEVAQKIADELDAAITPEEKQLIIKTPTASLIAYEFYIRAQQLLDSYWRDNDSRYMPEAQRLLDKALEIDPEYEMAIAAKGGVFLAQKQYDSILVYANRLMDLNPYSANGYFLKGEYYNFTNIPDSAIKNYLHAIKFFNKNEVSDKEWCEFQIGWVYCVEKNDHQKGLQYLQKGWDVKQKRDWVRPYMVGNIFLSIGDYEKSDKYFKMSLGIDESPLCIDSYSQALVVQSRSKEALNFLDTICKEPQSKVVCNQQKFYIHLMRKEFDQTKQFYTNFLNAGGTPNIGDSIWLSYLYKETGMKQAAIILLNRCQTSLKNQTVKNIDFHFNLNLASIYALLDNKEEALKNLTKSVDIGLRWGWHDFLEICPFFEKLWDDPDFKAIVHHAQNEKATIRSQVRKMEQSGETNL